MNGALDHSDQLDPDAIMMFVGQIPRSWSEKELKELFEPYGAFYQINVLLDRGQNPPQSKGTCIRKAHRNRSQKEHRIALKEVDVQMPWRESSPEFSVGTSHAWYQAMPWAGEPRKPKR
ncbi:hypothetical protein P7K49_016639 [Saguinus oedipus]|uniref:RRM domain-containing protein n=1 Tax=Saguinus oedipus TaxID=9490 RepID=A0ABQ9VD90_SAGOE|nr:hypothetical protein P7K49_016639 [Saguinus oedipus]